MSLGKVRTKLLIVVNYYYPYISGVSEYAKYMAECLSEEFEIIVLTGQHERNLKDKELVNGYWIYRAKPLFFFNKGYISLEFISLFRKLSKDADVINIHFPMLESGLLSLMTRKPVLLKYHCDMALVGNWISRVAVACVRQSGRIALKRSTSIVVSSDDYASNSFYLNGYNHKCTPIPPPNRFEGYNKEHVSSLTAKPSAYKVIGFVGRFVTEKGIDVLLKAAKNFKGQKVIFWLAGDFEKIAGGAIINEIKNDIKQLKEQVVLLGGLTDEELASFYSTIDILVLPSVNPFEAFGMVQLEAMTFGALPVASDLPGVREVVKRTKIGRLATPGSPESLTSALKDAILDCEKYGRKQIQDSVLKNFCNERFVSKYHGLVTSLAK